MSYKTKVDLHQPSVLEGITKIFDIIGSTDEASLIPPIKSRQRRSRRAEMAGAAATNEAFDRFNRSADRVNRSMSIVGTRMRSKVDS